MNAAITQIVNVTSNLMRKYHLRDLNEVPLSRNKNKAGIWAEICVSIFKVFNYADILRLKQWWTRDTHRFKTQVTQNLVDQDEFSMEICNEVKYFFNTILK